jgi:hypothetical protein
MVFLDGAPDQRRYRGVLGVGEIDRRHDLAGSSALEAPRDDQSIMDTFMLLALHCAFLVGHDGRRLA